MLTVAYFHLFHVIAIPAVFGLPQLPTRSPTDPKLLSFSSFFLAGESGIFHLPPWSSPCGGFFVGIYRVSRARDIDRSLFCSWDIHPRRPVCFRSHRGQNLHSRGRSLVANNKTATWPPSPSPISKHGARSSSVTGHQKIPVRSSSSASSSSWVSASSRYLPIVNGWHERPSGRPMKCKRCTNRSDGASEGLEEERAIMVSMGEDRRVIGGHCGRRLLFRRPDGR